MSRSPASAPRRSHAVPWPVVAALVIVFGAAGYVTVTLAETSVQHTVGEAMLTVALVAGPFLGAEALVTASTRPRVRPVAMSSSLAGRDLGGVDLSGHYLRRRQMSAVRLSESDLHGADLTEARLDDARLTATDLSGSTLHRSSMKSAACFRADLRNADLSESDLRWANLKQADLREASLVDADLRNADLRGADLRDADLRGAALKGARYSRTTSFTGALGAPNELARLGLIRHNDEPLAEPAGPLRPSITSRPAVRIGALAGVVAGLMLTVPALLPDDPTNGARVGGASETRTYYRVSGESNDAVVFYTNHDGAVAELVETLPMTIPVTVGTDGLSIDAHTLDGASISCEIHHGGAAVSEAQASGRQGVARCVHGG